MPDQKIELQEKTGVKISSAIGIGLVGLIGAASAAGLLYTGNQLNKSQKTSTTTTTVTNTNTTKSADLTNAPIPKATSTEEYSQAVAESNIQDVASGVSIRITSPAEGALIDDTFGNPLRAELTDTTGQVVALYARTFNDRYGYMIGWYNVSTPPYEWNTALSLYPSGEYRDVVYAKNAAGQFIASADVMYTKTHNCYYLAYQDMTTSLETVTVRAGDSFNITGTVKNYMRGACQNIYDLRITDRTQFDYSLPDGWTVDLNPRSLSLGVNQTGSFSATVNVPSSAAIAQAYNLRVVSHRQYTGIIVDKPLVVNVLAPGGGGIEPIETQ